MKKKILFGCIIFTCCLLPFSGYAAKKFQWEPVTEVDWAVTEDSAKGIHDAVIIFEKIFADDSKLLDEKCYYEIYRRIRILNSEGRKWGNVTVPFLDKKQKVERIYGRTILPDEKEILLDKSQVLEKEIYKTKGVKIKQKSFFLPAVSNNCIIEYYIKYRLPEPQNLWLIEKDIFMREGEFVWKFYRGRGMQDYIYSELEDFVTPNYTWLNTKKKIEVEQRPSIKDPEEIVFTIKYVAAFESEPYSEPDIALKGQLRCYYGGQVTPAAYWGDVSKSVLDGLEEFTKKNKQVQKVVESFGELGNTEEKIKTAYTWLQENIKNTTYDDSNEKFKDNSNVDDVIKHSYGNDEEINMIFYDMLREMNIDAKMAYTIDRDDNFLAYQAKYWQFDRSLVAVPNERGSYDFYNPGGKYLPIGVVAWVNEGTAAFVIGDMSEQFFLIPNSESLSNLIKRYQQLTMDESFQLKGKLVVKHKGHPARSFRLRLSQTTKREKTDYLQEKFSELFPNSEVDSISIEGLEDIDMPVTAKCNVKIAPTGQQMGNRFLLKPYDLFSKYENPFHSDERKYPIRFDYAKEIVEGLRIELPENWTVEALPSDSVFSNLLGVCQIDFNSYNDGKTLLIQRCFKLGEPALKAVGYAYVKNLFQAQQEFEEMTVVLKKKE